MAVATPYIGGSGVQVMKATSGTIGANVFIDGTGTSTMDGNTGNDTYSYVSSDGAMTISDTGGTDTLKLGIGMTAANLTLTENSTGTDLIILDGISGDQIDILTQISSAGDQVEKVIYGDGTTGVLNSALTLTATTGSTTLKGTTGNDTLIAVAGTGTETLEGGSGNDIYSYAAGDGAVVINETASTTTDTLKLAAGMTSSNVWIGSSNNGNDLLITDGTSGDSIDIFDGASTTSYKVETLIYGDGSTQSLTAVLAALSTATTLNGTTGNDVLVPYTGNLTLAGKGGNDLYDFGKGMGQDFINNGVSTTNSANGTLFFGHGIGDNQLWFDRVDATGSISATGNNLRIDIMGTTTSMTINNWYATGDTYADMAEFQVSDSGLKLDSQLANLVSAMANV